jgi:AraC-like DNA-binding protein
MAITLFLITLNLLFSPRILYGYYWTREGEARASVPPYAPKTSDDGDGVQVLKNLSAIVKEKSLYENVGYTIHNLAQEAKIPSYRISYLINTHTDGNFSKWINSFRIEKFIALSENGDTSKYTLDSIAPECGFSSRSTLTSAFKKEKGITPGQYMKQISFKG